MTRKIIAANWKEHPVTAKEARSLFDGTMKAAVKAPEAEVLVCPPAIFLEGLAERRVRMPKNAALGAQDVFWEDEGAFTGGVGPAMLAALGVRYAIIGHSERRRIFGETDAMINRKLRAAQAGGLRPIMCVGEPPEVRRKGIAAAKRYVARQLALGMKGVVAKAGRGAGAQGIIIAYEPLWAIGSGKNDPPADAAAMAAFIKSSAKGGAAKVLYGGSVNPENVRDYVQLKEIDGALVGGASLKAKEFGTLIRRSLIK
jgi:triosephosphate isomerase